MMNRGSRQSQQCPCTADRTRSPVTTCPATPSGSAWNLGERPPRSFTLIFFYRGYHCPICKAQLRDLDRHVSSFEELGVAVVACAMDNSERVQKTDSEWGLKQLQVGYDLSAESARE